MMTVKATIRKDKARASGECPIWLRIYHRGKSRWVSTGLFVEPHHWNPAKREVRKSHELHKQLNRKLQNLVTGAAGEAIDGANPLAVKLSVQGTGASLSDYLNLHIDRLRQHGQHWEFKKYLTLRVKLQDCFGRDLNFAEIRRPELVQFETFLRLERRNGKNMIRKEMTRLHRIYRLAVQDELIRPEQDPFLQYKLPKGTKVSRRKLSAEEIQALKDVDLPAGSRQALFRDMFMLAFYAGGARFGDTTLLRPANIRGGRVRYGMMKTGHEVDLKLPPAAVEILNRYISDADPFIFPLLRERETADPVELRKRISSWNALGNKSLQAVAVKAGIDPEGLSFHAARHSFADLCRSRTGDVHAIKSALGHSSVATTERYLKSLDQDAVDKMTDAVWQ